MSDNREFNCNYKIRDFLINYNLLYTFKGDIRIVVEFCPECGNMLRKKSCKCGYNNQNIHSKNVSNMSLNEIWDPPPPKIIYCKLTATSHNKLETMLSKRKYPEKLKDITKKLKNHLFSCCNCVYYNEAIFHCQIKNKYLTKESICRSFEPYE